MRVRVRRRVSENFGMIAVPVVCIAVSIYFGYSGIAGPRGLVARDRTEEALALKQQELAQLQRRHAALQHRIQLLDSEALDPDLLDEVARKVLSEGRTGEVSVPRRPSH